jgi:hypothetical protein
MVPDTITYRRISWSDWVLPSCSFWKQLVTGHNTKTSKLQHPIFVKEKSDSMPKWPTAALENPALPPGNFPKLPHSDNLKWNQLSTFHLSSVSSSKSTHVHFGVIILTYIYVYSDVWNRYPLSLRSWSLANYNCFSIISNWPPTAEITQNY